MTKDLIGRLEDEIDRCGLKAVLNALAIICEEKAEHVMHNWQDQVLAAAWRRTGSRIDSAAAKTEVI